MWIYMAIMIQQWAQTIDLWLVMQQIAYRVIGYAMFDFARGKGNC